MRCQALMSSSKAAPQRSTSSASPIRPVSHSRAGSTALMHMQWRGFSPSAIAQIKSGLAKKGLQVCRNQGRPTPVKPAWMSC